jgi:hypothetical protein
MLLSNLIIFANLVEFLVGRHSEESWGAPEGRVGELLLPNASISMRGATEEEEEELEEELDELRVVVVHAQRGPYALSCGASCDQQVPHQKQLPLQHKPKGSTCGQCWDPPPFGHQCNVLDHDAVALCYQYRGCEALVCSDTRGFVCQVRNNQVIGGPKHAKHPMCYKSKRGFCELIFLVSNSRAALQNPVGAR